MSKPIDDIAQYLADNSIGTLATNLFKAYLPDKPDSCVVVYDTGGFEPDSYIPTGNPTFQIFVRSTNYTDGKAKVDSIVNLLHRKANIQLVTSGVYFYYIKLMNEPVHIGRDKNERDEFSINLITHIRR
jgi:hypothetical protein